MLNQFEFSRKILLRILLFRNYEIVLTKKYYLNDFFFRNFKIFFRTFELIFRKYDFVIAYEKVEFFGVQKILIVFFFIFFNLGLYRVV